MPVSDDDYIEDASDDEIQITRSTRPKRGGLGTDGAWEVSRTWESVVEGADGTITSAVDGLLEAGKRKR
jgi:transcription initiation factor TFIIH subunit 2